MSARRRARFALAVAIALVAFVAGACGLTGSVTGPRSWAVGSVDSNGRTTNAQVTDHSGRVQSVEVDPGDATPGPVVVAAPGTPNAVDVTWNAGACDDQTAIDIAAAGAGLVVTVQTHHPNQPCDAIAIQRVLRLQLDRPIPPGSVAVRQ